MPGFTVLETGYFDDDGTTHGKRIEGLSSHTEVLTWGSTAWRDMFNVVTGRVEPDPIPEPRQLASATPPPSLPASVPGNPLPSPSAQPAPRPTGAP
jgi:hypothetical protein